VQRILDLRRDFDVLTGGSGSLFRAGSPRYEVDPMVALRYECVIAD
jgi:hypothetical protein